MEHSANQVSSDFLYNHTTTTGRLYPAKMAGFRRLVQLKEAGTYSRDVARRTLADFCKDAAEDARREHKIRERFAPTDVIHLADLLAEDFEVQYDAGDLNSYKKAAAPAAAPAAKRASAAPKKRATAPRGYRKA